ncbi:DgyrCDS5013 [Dimorphilus gyrociliatus]|uniref:DgyrCDS5013 n=1 Tax=Dimorphilus gyrociliatus TaxID=2664684 RepID=A0A7I8VL89_9ANNE|nr:DgyrCDS5013 [Dimorphilus gyrociliatus]
MSDSDVRAHQRAARRKKILSNPKSRLERIAKPDLKPNDLTNLDEEDLSYKFGELENNDPSESEKLPPSTAEEPVETERDQFLSSPINEPLVPEKFVKVDHNEGIYRNFAILVILGIITRILFCTGFGNCVLKNIWVPFILMQIAKYNLKRKEKVNKLYNTLNQNKNIHLFFLRMSQLRRKLQSW